MGLRVGSVLVLDQALGSGSRATYFRLGSEWLVLVLTLPWDFWPVWI